MLPSFWVASTKPESALVRRQGQKPWQGRGWALAPRDRGPGAGVYCWVGHLFDDPIDLEDLGVLAVDVDAVRARDVPDVLGVRVASVLLGRVLRERGHLALQVRPLEREVGLVVEVEVVPGDLVAENRGSVGGPQPFL